MKIASVIQIVNRTNRDIFLWPIDEEMRDLFGRLIHANSFSIFESPPHFAFDLDGCYFQFKGLKRKIKHSNLHKHNIDLIIMA